MHELAFLVGHGWAPARGSSEPLPWASFGAFALLGGGCLGLGFLHGTCQEQKQGPSPGLFGGGDWISTRPAEVEPGTLHELNRSAAAPLGQHWDADFTSMEISPGCIPLLNHFWWVQGKQAFQIRLPTRLGTDLHTLHFKTCFNSPQCYEQ